MEKMRYLKPEISILLPIHANYEKITFYTVIDMRESCYEVFLDSVTQTCEISFLLSSSCWDILTNGNLSSQGQQRK